MKITEDIKLEINELYYELKSYAAVAREIGCSAGTVKKYVDPSFCPVTASEIIRFQESEIPDTPYQALLELKNIGEICILSSEEEKELEDLRKEILL